MVQPGIKMQLKIALRPTKSSQVMQLFHEWIAKRPFELLDFVVKEMLGSVMVGVNLLNAVFWLMLAISHKIPNVPQLL